MIKRFRVLTVVCLSVVWLSLLAGCVEAEQVVNVYSARHYDTDLEVYKNFENETGIKVNLIEAKSDALIERIVNEGEYSPADVLLTVDAGRLFRADQRQIFARTDSSLLRERVPAHLRHPDNLWFGLSKRARVIVYRKDAGRPEGLESYQDLADSRFKGQVCIRSSSNIYNISLLASLVEHLGESEAERWAQGVVDNFYRKPQGNDTANAKAVASGECGLAVVNSYYVARMIANDDPLGKALGIIFPNQNARGTHINISGGGVLKNAPNRANAVRFLEYLTEPSAQALYVSGNHEYPIVAAAETLSLLDELGTFQEDKINASLLGANQEAAVKVFDRVGWY